MLSPNPSITLSAPRCYVLHTRQKQYGQKRTSRAVKRMSIRLELQQLDGIRTVAIGDRLNLKITKVLERAV